MGGIFDMEINKSAFSIGTFSPFWSNNAKKMIKLPEFFVCEDCWLHVCLKLSDVRLMFQSYPATLQTSWGLAVWFNSSHHL